VLVDSRELPIELHLSEGQGSDCKEAGSLLDVVPGGSPILADKTSDSDAISDKVEARGNFANIPPKANRKRSFAFSSLAYRHRNLVERFFAKLKRTRDLAKRWTNAPTTSSPPSNSSQHTYGSLLMSPGPETEPLTLMPT
jgi:transposase